MDAGHEREPCTLEKFAELLAARGVWAEQGRDVEALFQERFGISSLDWSNLGAFWNVRIGADRTLSARLGELIGIYKARYLSPL